MREATIHRARLDNLRLALSNFSSIILRNLNKLHSYISLTGDAPPPVIETDKDAASEVRKQCLLMMCLQAPMASDLKFTLAALRIGQDYERLHELTSSLAERFCHLRKSGDATLVEEVRNVLSHIISVHASMRSTWSRDIYETELITADPAAAALIGVINGELSRLQKHYTNFLAQGKQGIEMCADLILTCRHLQRMTQLLESLPEEMHCFEQSVDELVPIMR